MSNQYRLLGVGNAELVAGLSKLVQQSNSLTAQVLAHLVELDERRLHLELGFSSLFAYCVEGLGMSEGTAGRRVAAARVCRRFPEVFERIARGELHLCALCALAPHLDEQNAAALFDASKDKTRRQIEELLAARFPRPDVREQIRRLPSRAQGLTRFAAREGMSGTIEQALPPSWEREAVCEPQRGAATSASPEIAGIAARYGVARPEIVTELPRRPRPRTRELEPLSADRFGVHFTADAELRELIERARALASHRIPNGDLAGLMKLMAASFVKQEEKRRFGIGVNRRRASGEVKASGGEVKASGALEPLTPPDGAPVLSSTSEAATHVARPTPSGSGKHSRYLRVRVRREIHARDGGQCAFVSADGRRCNARGFIQFDHVDPFARNGSSDTPNLRLLCKAHNLLHARKCFGNQHIEAKIARNRGASWPRPR